MVSCSNDVPHFTFRGGSPVKLSIHSTYGFPCADSLFFPIKCSKSDPDIFFSKMSQRYYAYFTDGRLQTVRHNLWKIQEHVSGRGRNRTQLPWIPALAPTPAPFCMKGTFPFSVACVCSCWYRGSTLSNTIFTAMLHPFMHFAISPRYLWSFPVRDVCGGAGRRLQIIILG